MIAARSIGPYSIVTQQPLATPGDTRAAHVTRPTFEALVARGAVNVAHELATIKCDDLDGRKAAYTAIVRGEPIDDDTPIAAPASASTIETHLLALGFEVSLRTGEIAFATSESIRARCPELVMNAETYTDADHAPIPGGLFCTDVFGALDGTDRWHRFGRVELAQPIRHPWAPDVELDVWPILPPAHRPITRLRDGRFATTDINDLYRRLFDDEVDQQRAIDAIVDNRHGVHIPDSKRWLVAIVDSLVTRFGRALNKTTDYACLGPSEPVTGDRVRLPRTAARRVLAPWLYAALSRTGRAATLKAAVALVQAGDADELLAGVLAMRPGLVVPTAAPTAVFGCALEVWDGDAIGVPSAVAIAGEVAVHLPIGERAVAELRTLRPGPAPSLARADGWIARAADAPDSAALGALLTAAALAGERDSLLDPIARLVVGLRSRGCDPLPPGSVRIA